jgi:hypothetical protein
LKPTVPQAAKIVGDFAFYQPEPLSYFLRVKPLAPEIHDLNFSVRVEAAKADIGYQATVSSTFEALRSIRLCF